MNASNEAWGILAYTPEPTLENTGKEWGAITLKYEFFYNFSECQKYILCFLEY